MSPDAQQIAIAEACGWRDIKHELLGVTGTTPEQNHVQGNGLLPNYLNDLNAMHEAEKTLSAHSQQDRFVNALWIAIGAGIYGNIDREAQEWIMIHSTAAQRAEAFLLTIGKWKSGK